MGITSADAPYTASLATCCSLLQEHQERLKIAEEEREGAALAAAQAAANSAAAAAAAAAAGEPVGLPAAAAPVRSTNKVHKPTVDPALAGTHLFMCTDLHVPWLIFA